MPATDRLDRHHTPPRRAFELGGAVAPTGTTLREDCDEVLARAGTGIDAEGVHEIGLARFVAVDRRL